jgi:hypothetical protein
MKRALIAAALVVFGCQIRERHHCLQRELRGGQLG